MLNVLTQGDPKAPPLIIAHGLFGSARNWGVIAKRLSDRFHVITPDMRNHGASPWFDTHSYFDMAGDLAQLIDAPAFVVGHSMGGKAAMVLALERPELVRRLIVADIAPVTYGHSQIQHIEAMRRVDLAGLEKRSDAGAALDPQVRDFLLQSLDVQGRRWTLNLDVLEAEMPRILGFPEVSGTYAGEALFLSGDESDYVLPAHRPAIKALFPKARFAKLRGAGHWLHAQKPREFEAAVRAFCV
ncbi:alpha/beta fold hydrolase [Thalassorhabdomicrobium marinisediminis]|uniref:alpha/beta fold hydrolase n=1 Tax=Thalassorhabdomicrobium marinisediminis TaxID=2170577 RepID=UPI0024916603|nr:alpha/beta fold hydrolase [Thalassorhabdomicrobium marinisediminis]